MFVLFNNIETALVIIIFVFIYYIQGSDAFGKEKNSN